MIANNFDALVLALKLGITAETDEQISLIEKEIDWLASISAPEDIDLAKAKALQELGMLEEEK
jgi:hypothetical protein